MKWGRVYHSPPWERTQHYDSWFVDVFLNGQSGFMVWLCNEYLFSIGNHEASEDWQELKCRSYDLI
ncbi:MAG: hypothetical protein AAGB31_13220 [Bdellovibrio sp.]